jgi:hypothetical protein
MSGIRVDFDVDIFPILLQRVLELLHIVRRNAPVVTAKVSQNRGMDFLQRLPIIDQMAVVDDVRG